MKISIFNIAKRLALIGMLSVGTVNAATVVCSGTVEYVGFHANDSLMIRLSSMNASVYFCNPEVTWTVAGTTQTMGPQSCKALLAIFLSAKASGTPINSLYFDGNDVPATCDSWGPWKRALVRYFQY